MANVRTGFQAEALISVLHFIRLPMDNKQTQKIIRDLKGNLTLSQEEAKRPGLTHYAQTKSLKMSSSVYVVKGFSQTPRVKLAASF